ncbi:MAG: hypothetical protein K2I07_00750 [Lachnospiraceae bacterium]|nr:hypothetical protein [Lachnospiraceae bacterium]
MTIDFKNTEDSDVMDCREKGGRAAQGSEVGLEGMMRQVVNLLEYSAVTAVGLIILGTMNIFVMLVLVGLSAIGFAAKNHANKKCKKEVWDPLANWWRRNHYMSNTTCDFAAAKDIRMFGLREWLTEKFKKEKKTKYEGQIKNEKIWLCCSTCNIFCFAASQIIVYGWLLYKALRGEMTIGNFSLYVASSTTFYTYVWQIMDSIADLLQRSREVDDWRSFLDMDGGNPDVGKEVPEYDSYEFEFRNVSLGFLQWSFRIFSFLLSA